MLTFFTPMYLYTGCPKMNIPKRNFNNFITIWENKKIKNTQVPKTCKFFTTHPLYFYMPPIISYNKFPEMLKFGPKESSCSYTSDSDFSEKNCARCLARVRRNVKIAAFWHQRISRYLTLKFDPKGKKGPLWSRG